MTESAGGTPWIGPLDLFRIGLGPSSSHTVGPMVAAADFAARLPAGIERISAHLYGSLALTGRGHATDTALLLGLTGAQPDTLDPDDAAVILATIQRRRRLTLPSGEEVLLDPAADIVFHPRETLPLHSNGLSFTATGRGDPVGRAYYSIGGGFVLDEAGGPLDAAARAEAPVPHPFGDAAELLRRAEDAGLTIAELVRRNESVAHPGRDLSAGLARIWSAMRACVARGLAGEGELPGGLRVRRRAAALLRRLEVQGAANDPDLLGAMDWVNLWALAVNEENAAGGRVVTAPTNGAAGIIPAVLHYYDRFVPGASPAGVETFLLAASAIGAIIKRNASISGAEMGCQGEVGSACAMAAGGLAAALGGSNAQVENAAEIGLEHNLGLTCDPVGGLVQVPCIERNAIAAVKAINACRLALHGDGTHRVSLDQAVATMRQTGRDMSYKYKETSLGGLAVNVVAC
ncbi:L-serine ammonia-lyase [Roseomonas sp. JC162]|uniref:L-serine dehydratase n=1 Tax=Neoroseomonas marina TaxID=1232220 RepID=A0A848EC12_9PROT|nr:L-serine ammonia-lyase [Neoroseomonas marina]NMJ41067.1 L-serine ammonia-lyase [Neoroseomonas marina]